MNIGLICNTTRKSGVGAIAYDIVRNLPVAGVLSVHTVKGQDRWTDNQVDCHRPVGPVLEQWLDSGKFDWVMGVETMFGAAVVDLCRMRSIKTAVLVMQETYRPGVMPVDLFICPHQMAYDKFQEQNKVLFSWPIDLYGFPFTERTEAKRFLHLCGYGTKFNRRQTREAVEGFMLADLPGTTLTVHCQQDWGEAYGVVDDPRIIYRTKEFNNPAGVYAGFDVLLQTDAYAGYCRPLLEAQACGMPVLATEAEPMNFYTPRDNRIRSSLPPEWYEPHDDKTKRGLNTWRQLLTADDVARALNITVAWDVSNLSWLARAKAESKSWNNRCSPSLLAAMESI